MKRSADSAQEADDRVREIPKWARRYAQSRTLPMLVFFSIYALGAGAIVGLWCLTEWAYYVAGQRYLAGAALLLLINAVVCLMWFAFAGGSRICHRIARRLYAREGNVTVRPSPQGKAERGHGRLGFLSILLMVAIFACTVLGTCGLIPLRYMQPISALYVVPIIVHAWIRGGRAASPILLLWPVLYGIHAILLVAYAPLLLHFGGEYPPVLQGLNIAIPLLGYAVVAALGAHLYSRYALRRLRTLATSPETPDQSIEGGRS